MRKLPGGTSDGSTGSGYVVAARFPVNQGVP
jgi:hypothetical protein